VIAGAVLDPSLIASFGRGDPDTMLAIHQFDMKAQALLIPMTAMTEGLACLATPAEMQRALYLLEFGVVVQDDLHRGNTQSVATAHLTAQAETTLGMAHTAVASRERGWKVLTCEHTTWTAAHPDVDVAATSD
jgi:hypothetical protein